MNPGGSGGNSGPDDPDLGIPVNELLGLEESAPPPAFLLGVRNKIDRRRTTGQLVSFSWSLPKVILMEMVGWLNQLPDLFSGKKD